MCYVDQKHVTVAPYADSGAWVATWHICDPMLFFSLMTSTSLGAYR